MSSLKPDSQHTVPGRNVVLALFGTAGVYL